MTGPSCTPLELVRRGIGGLPLIIDMFGGSFSGDDIDDIRLAKSTYKISNLIGNLLDFVIMNYY